MIFFEKKTTVLLVHSLLFQTNIIMRNWKLLLATICIAGMASCAGEATEETTPEVTPAGEVTTPHEHPMGEVIAEKNGLKLTTVTGSPDFPDATLKMVNPAEGGKLKAGTTTFAYEVQMSNTSATAFGQPFYNGSAHCY